MNDQARRFFRLNYPIRTKPVVHVHQQKYEVLDVSQGGIRFHVTEPDQWLEDDPFKAQIYMVCGGSASVSGKILRVAADFVVVELSEEIPLKLMYDEHRFLLKNFPDSYR